MVLTSATNANPMVRITINPVQNGSVDKVSQWFDQNKNFTAKITPTYSGSGCSWTSNVSGISSSGATITFKADRAVTLTPKISVPSYTLLITGDWKDAYCGTITIKANGTTITGTEFNNRKLTVPVGSTVEVTTATKQGDIFLYGNGVYTYHHAAENNSGFRFTMPAYNMYFYLYEGTGDCRAVQIQLHEGYQIPPGGTDIFSTIP